jgi:RNA polymerase sigma-70 factor (ECF subfamily)
MDEDLADLARAAAAGNLAAFEAIVRRTHSHVWRFCAYLVDTQTADDLTQDTYLRAQRGLTRYRGDAPLRAWLLTIARRVCAAEIDARQRHRDLCLTVGAPLTQPPVHDPTSVVDVDLLIASLTDERRAAFVLTQVIGCDYAETAQICGVPVGTIRSRVSRARSDLVEKLRDTSATPSSSARR